MIFKSRHEIMADYYLNKTILDIKLNQYPEEINSIGLNIENKDLKIKKICLVKLLSWIRVI